MPLGATTRAILEHIGELGYVVTVEYSDGHVVTATSETGERWTMRGQDIYRAACELAAQVGADARDG